jgi:hypothetical protein
MTHSLSHNLTKSARNILLLSAASLVLAACGGGTVATPGNSGPVTISPPVSPPPAATVIDLVPVACSTGTTLTTITVGDSEIEACAIDKDANGAITADLTLDPNIGYALVGPTFVGVDGGVNATLTIPAGTTIFGASDDGDDYLVITRGSKIEANGTAANPIIMTARADILGDVDPINSRGLWGGLVLNGFAPINACDTAVAGGSANCEKTGEGASGKFGGNISNDDSGTLSYVQVRYAGNQLNNNDELNGIAFQGVGSETQCDHIQVHNNADDGVEFFGGTVSCSYMVLTGNADDSLDWTDGWTGSAQFVVVQHTDGAGDQGIEADNNGDNNTLTPRSNPTIANFTFDSQNNGDIGILLREGTDARICNGVITGFTDGGLDIDNSETLNNATSGTLTVESVALDNPTNIISGDSDETFDAQAFFDNGANNAEVTNSLQDGFFPGPVELAVDACDLSNDPRVLNVDYIGAFGPSESLANSWATGWTFNLLPDVAASGPIGTTETTEVVNGKTICELGTGASTTLTEDVRLTNNFVYRISGAVFVGEDAGGDIDNPVAGATSATLRIDSGTTLYGTEGEDYLVIRRGSQIRSNGTALAPVIFTSEEDVFQTAGFDAANDRAQWGGLVINGRAPINACDTAVAGGSASCEKSGEGASGKFGGNAPEDNSGNLYYTRVSYAGNQLNNNDELNGIAFQGVGSGTEVDYIQVHNNADDGIEFFGGTVNVKHVVLTGNADDSLDWTDGWTGKAQYVIVQHASNAGDQAIEADNNGDNNTLTPRSNPTLSNLTLVGTSGTDIGILVREGTAASIVNTIITGFNDGGLDIDQSETAVQAVSGNLNFNSLYIVDTGSSLVSDGDSDAELVAAFAAGNNNVDGEAQTPAQDSTLNGFVPGTNELAVTSVDPSTLDPFFDSVNYIGAVENANDTWYQGWTLLVTE